MTDKYCKENFEGLKKEIETLIGREVNSPKDFDFLSRQILGYTGENISVSTLKRMWGYVASKSAPSRFSLDVMARMAGYSSWEAYAENCNGGGTPTSRFFVKSKLVANALNTGDRIRLTWAPGRVVTIRYIGNDIFSIEDSVKSKLSAGDTFCCHQFVADEPLYLTSLQHLGMQPCNYVAGLQSGIKWEVID